MHIGQLWILSRLIFIFVGNAACPVYAKTDLTKTTFIRLKEAASTAAQVKNNLVNTLTTQPNPIKEQNRLNSAALLLVEAARQQIGVTRNYDPGYTKINYPMGDVDRSKGVCTDVVVRALRDSQNIDLQQLVHIDMQKNFKNYPKLWGLIKPDSNIDHRRVPNLQVYFKRQGYEQPISQSTAAYTAGDIVTVKVPAGLDRTPTLPHIMIVSDRLTRSGVPLIIHNIGLGTQEEDMLFRYPITGHYRIFKN